MVALAYETLGGINGVTENPKVPASTQSRDRNNKQRLAFACDPTRPFTGIINVQASVGEPNRADADMLWFDIAEMVIDNEGGTWSYEPEGEFSAIRVICRTGNYWSATHGNAAAISGLGGTFTINTFPIVVIAGADAATIAAAINADGAIIGDGTIVADVINTNQLRIYKTDGASLVIADTINTPMADMGITGGTIKGGVISAIRMLR